MFRILYWYHERPCPWPGLHRCWVNDKLNLAHWLLQLGHSVAGDWTGICRNWQWSVSLLDTATKGKSLWHIWSQRRASKSRSTSKNRGSKSRCHTPLHKAEITANTASSSKRTWHTRLPPCCSGYGKAFLSTNTSPEARIDTIVETGNLC